MRLQTAYFTSLVTEGRGPEDAQYAPRPLGPAFGATERERLLSSPGSGFSTGQTQRRGLLSFLRGGKVLLSITEQSERRPKTLRDQLGN